MNVNLQEIINKLQTAKGELQKQQRFAQFATGLEEIISHTSEPLMLMVMGSFSTGKSSFINALVGEEIAAVEAKPTTAVVTKLCYGKQDKLLLHFRDGRVQSATPQEFTRMTAVNDEEKLNEIHEKLDYVERQMPLEMLKQVSIIDSPGLNDVKEKRSEATERFVSKADTVLWMFSVVQLATREEMAAMDRLTPRLKPIAVVNKMDLLDEEEDDPAEFLAKARQTLKGRVQAVVGISAKYELAGKKENNALKREIGNFAELEKAVADLVLPHREKFKLNTLLDELGAYFAAFNREFAKAKKENEANKSGNYAVYMQNEERFMQVEDILANVISGIQDYCEREAGRNNEQALYLLGVLYEGGIGVLQDTDKALQFYQKAAMRNHQDAMIHLYAFYRNNGSDDTANYWLQKLAEQGLAEAQNAYADRLSNAEKYKEAIQWYEKAAKQGYACAQAHLVEHYIYGVGVDTDYNIAKQWCEKAVEQYYPVAQYFMAEYFIKNQTERYVWYRKAAEQGYAKAQNTVARYLEEGWGGITKNQAEAVELYRKAAEQGYAIAQNNLGNCLYAGRGCAEDKAEAFKWYKKAAEQNIANAQNMVGRYLEEGWGGVEKSEEEAVEWFRRAANNKEIAAQYNLANCLLFGHGCYADAEEAVEWYRKAADQGNVDAQYALAKCLENGRGCDADIEVAVEWYRKVAERGNEHAKIAIVRLAIKNGSLKQEDNYIINNLEPIFEIAKTGNEYAQYIVADKLYYGKDCIVNREEAIKWYELAAEKGYEDARKKLEALSINTSQIVQNESSIDNITNLRKAAEQGDADAQYALAKCLENGSMCDEDEKEALCLLVSPMAMTIGHGCFKGDKEAVNWYKKAAVQGHMKAQYNLAYCLENGKGCEKDMQGALEWYKRAAEQGNRSAESGIERIENSFNSSHQSAASTQVAAQSSGCLLPILFTLIIIGLIAVL